LELIDTHCHMDMDPLIAEVDPCLDRARRAGVVQCLTVGTTVDSSHANAALAQRSPMLFASVGIHPHHAVDATERALEEIESLSEAPRVVAIGEVGLDHYYTRSPVEAQARALRAFVALAQRRALPLIIHCRDAYAELLETLAGAARQPISGVIHCASGPPAFITQALALGLHVSFSGTVTFRNAEMVQALVPLVPDDRLLIETDAPYLAPEPVRGRPNEPAHVRHTAEFLARLRGTTLEALAERTTRNARRLFRLPDPSDVAQHQ
jgi:TatD DNase family protein